jgi:DNA-binding LacI/PurR family transcriptional regulator
MESVINPFFATLFEAIRRDCEKNGYFVMLHTLSDRRYSRSDFAYADGIILCFPDDPSHVGNILEAAGDTPMALIHGCPTQPHVPTVLVDIGKGSAEAASCLLKLGCRSFVSVGGDRESAMSRVKNEAIRQTLSGQNAVMQSLSVEQSHSGGIRAVELLEGQLSGVDAILCESDAIAAGVLSALHRIGFRVPEDIRVMGYDDILLASMFNPPISTVSIPIGQLGSAAVNMVCCLISGKNAEDQHFAPTLTLRATT